MNNCITISTKKDSMVIKLNEDAEQKDIISCLEKRLPKLQKLYKDDKTPIVVTGKILKNKEIDEIQNLIKSNIDVAVSFDSPRILGLHGIKRTYSKAVAISETKFHKGSLRSGQKIEYEGSMVVLGDVNDGAEVIAGENIVVLGILRGLAHAGAKGNTDAIIAASAIEAPQLRIANIVEEREKEDTDDKTIKTYAYINDQYKMVIE